MTGDAAPLPPDARPYRLDGCFTLAIDAPVIGESYRIDVALPGGAVPARGWPLLLLLDGGRCFAACVEAMRQMAARTDATAVSEMAIAAISSAGHADPARRRRDFTTPPARSPDAAGHRADRFLDFLENALVPLLGDRVPLDPARRMIMGHSLSGYFALWALATRPALFGRVAAISPSLWWDKDLAFRLLGEADLGSGTLFLAVGEWEEGLAPWQAGSPGSEEVRARREGRRMVGNVRALGELAIGRGLALPEDVHVFDRQEHASITFAAMPHVLRFASRPA